MKRLCTVFIVVFALGFILVLLHGYGSYLNAMSATIALRRSEGLEILRKIEQSHGAGPLWPSDLSKHLDFTNSTDFINILNMPSRGALTPASNIWMVVKNLPTDAPPNFIVLATRNVDPSFLRSRLSEHDMDKPILFTKNAEQGLLKEYAIFIRRDGSAFVSKCSRMVSCRLVYDNRTFDVSKKMQGDLSIKYLLPQSEITISCSAR